jgi:hypothetical protein
MFTIVREHLFQGCRQRRGRDHHSRQRRYRDSITNQFELLEPSFVVSILCRPVLIPDVLVAYLMRRKRLQLLGFEKLDGAARNQQYGSFMQASEGLWDVNDFYGVPFLSLVEM